MKVDLPIMIDNRFMKLRGNEKTLIGQLMLLPIVKTDNDTVQIVSNYNKIFVRNFIQNLKVILCYKIGAVSYIVILDCVFFKNSHNFKKFKN